MRFLAQNYMAETVLNELETSTSRKFMPLVVNQMYQGSPILERIFKTSQEGEFGLALPKQNWAIKICFDKGDPEIGNPSQTFGYEAR
jgi:hypothetical protein